MVQDENNANMRCEPDAANKLGTSLPSLPSPLTPPGSRSTPGEVAEGSTGMRGESSIPIRSMSEGPETFIEALIMLNTANAIANSSAGTDVNAVAGLNTVTKVYDGTE